MTSLLLLLSGPMQSWGDAAQWSQRHTLDHPTRSGLTGIIAAALGYERGRDLTDLDPLCYTIRVDRPAIRISDFHTVGGAADNTLPRAKGGSRDEPIVSNRHYLSDAAFTVAISGPESLVTQVKTALRKPVFAPFLGRRSCPTAGPL